VNKKLIQQEVDCFNQEKERLERKKLNPSILKSEIRQLKSSIMKTKPSPPFEKVVAMYEKQRAGCNKSTKRCS
jgi:hypothetical protein